MTSELTRAELLNIIETDHVQCGEASALARMALAAMDSEPVGTLSVRLMSYSGKKIGNQFGFAHSDAAMTIAEGDYQLYRHAQPAPVAQKEPISFDEWSRKCALQITLCYPDFREKAQYIWDSARETQQPAPVVPEDVSIFEAAIEECKTCDSIDEHAWNHGVLAVIAKYESCRAAMLAAAPQSPGSEPATVPGKWIPVSERMPEDSGRYWCYVEEQNDLGKSHYQWNCSWNGDRWWVESEGGGIVTHWMPLPAAPQEVK